MKPLQRHITLFILLTVVVIIVFVLQLVLGSVSIPLPDIIGALTGGKVENETWRNIIIESRLPGALAALFAGAGLSVSGLQMQTMFRNPVAGPYVLGISAGASLGVAVAILAGSAFGFSVHLLSGWTIIIAASLGAILIFLVNFFITFRLEDVVAILIIGLMIGGGISAFIEILQSFSGNEALKHYVLWTFGSFRYVNLTQVYYLIAIVVIGTVFSFFLSKPLNLLLMGDAYATTSGLNVQRIKLMLVLCTSLLAGGITAFCGPIGFVGLAVPHISRSVFKTSNHKILTPASALTGAVITCLCNLLAAMPGYDYVVPINAVTSLLGAPVVIWIIIKQRRA
ncbi:MAG TPA: iron ABC transporter permease [Chitinophagales bacterium]|nr:iron ABC transporter permease [Chitinophagales bacterium]